MSNLLHNKIIYQQLPACTIDTKEKKTRLVGFQFNLKIYAKKMLMHISCTLKAILPMSCTVSGETSIVFLYGQDRSDFNISLDRFIDWWKAPPRNKKT